MIKSVKKVVSEFGHLVKAACMVTEGCVLMVSVFIMKDGTMKVDLLNRGSYSVTHLYKGPIRKFRGGWIESDETLRHVWTDGKRLIVR